MQVNDYLLLGSIAALTFLGNNVGLAQSEAPIPQQVSGGHAEFKPLLRIPSTATRAMELLTKLTFRSLYPRFQAIRLSVA